MVIPDFHLEDLPRVLAIVADRAREAGFASSRIPEIELVVEELLVNIVSHGYESGHGDIELDCHTSGDRKSLTVEIADWGKPFDIRNAPEPPVPTDLETQPIGGVGLTLIQRMTDEVIYRRERDRNELRLVFRHRHTE